jgi:hypothetical protein
MIAEILRVLREIIRSLVSLHQKADQIMSAQGDINQAVQVLNALFTDTAKVIAELQAGDGVVDTSKLNAIIAQVPAVQSALNGLAGTPASTSTSTVTPVSTGTSTATS